NIPGGDEFSGAIEKALASAEVVVVAWSESSIHSAWVRDEAATGRDNTRLVPVMLDGCLPPLGFRQIQTIDLSGWKGQARSRLLAPLIEAIARKAGATGLEESRPKPARASGHRPARRWALVAVLLLMVVGGGALYPRIAAWNRPNAVPPKVSLGQFAVISRELPRELSQVISQEILAAFGAENAVAVVAASSGGSAPSAPFIMDGSVRKLEDAVRFTMSLKNEKSGVVVWSKAYDHAVADGLAPRQVAVEASQVVRCGLWGASSYRGRMSDQALALYFQFCNEFWGGSSSETAILDAARRVTVAVPEFSFGWSALALAAVPLSHRTDSADTEQLRREAMEAAHKSVKLDPLNPEGYMAMAGLLPLDRFVEREKLLKKAISVRPTECGCERQSYGDFLTSVGRMAEAVEEYERARAMMPLAPNSNVRFVHALYMVGQNDEADRILAQMLELWPNADSLRLLKMKSAYWTERYGEALTLLRSSELHMTEAQRDALIATFEALASKSPSRQAEAAKLLRGFSFDARKNDRLIVAALAALGDKPAALEAARNLVRSRGNMNAAVLFEPNLADASRTPPYANLVKQLGLSGYWRSTKLVPDVCREANKPIFCT
ncbi:MAG: TIR domain-containing protein, partial [Sphingomicrobium sp.]